LTYTYYYFGVAKETEAKILRKRCKLLSQEINDIHDTKWKNLVDKTNTLLDYNLT